MASLAEDEIDDLLYFSRVNEATDFAQTLAEASSKYSLPKAQILQTAVDADSGNTPLHFASANGHIDIVRCILAVFSNDPSNSTSAELKSEIINAQNGSSNTPLHWAALNGHVQVIKLLLEHEADPSILNAAGHDALFEAELNDKAEAVEALLAEGKQLETGIGERAEEDDNGGALSAEEIDPDAANGVSEPMSFQDTEMSGAAAE